MADEAQKAAVYVAWPTFKNSLDRLAQGIPNVIDRTVFPGLSGGVQSQLFAGMRFLGLIDEKSIPQPALHDLAAPDEAERKTKLAAILRDEYAQLFALDLEKTTPGQLLETMRTAYGVSGDTAEKAMRFFLSAVEYADIPVSQLLKSGKAANGGPTTRRRGRKPKQQKPAEQVNTPPPLGGAPPPTGGESRSVTLKSGGTLTISATVGWLSLSTSDRNFVFGLIDKLAEYEQDAADDEQG